MEKKSGYLLRYYPKKSSDYLDVRNLDILKVRNPLSGYYRDEVLNMLKEYEELERSSCEKSDEGIIFAKDGSVWWKAEGPDPLEVAWLFKMSYKNYCWSKLDELG